MAIHLKNGTIDSIGTDTGTSSSDFVTSDQTLIIHGNVSTNGHGGSLTLGIWLSGGSFGVANGGKGTLVGTVGGITASGLWSFNLTTSSVTAAQLLANGSYTIHLTNGTTIGASELASRTIDVDHFYELRALVSGIESHGVRRRTENGELIQVTNLYHAW